MTLNELLAFKGTPADLEQFKKLLEKRDRLIKALRKLSVDIEFEDDAIQVLTDFGTTKKDIETRRQHENKRAALSVKQDKKIKEYNQTIDAINQFTTR